MDFAVLRGLDPPVKLFLSATDVRSGRLKVFERHEISADAVLASACLPFVFHAVEIGGEAYWDGGYTGPPALFPLIRGCAQHQPRLPASAARRWAALCRRGAGAVPR